MERTCFRKSRQRTFHLRHAGGEGASPSHLGKSLLSRGNGQCKAQKVSVVDQSQGGGEGMRSGESAACPPRPLPAAVLLAFMPLQYSPVKLIVLGWRVL